MELNSMATPEVVSIKYSKPIFIINFFSSLVVIIICIFFLYLLSINNRENSIIFAVMPVGLIIFFLIRIFIEYKKITIPALQISSKGIKLSNKALMRWENIEQEKIIFRTFSHKESKHNNRKEINYLFFYFKNERFEIKIDDFNIPDSELNDYLKLFREKYNSEKTKIL